jgi:transmembrane sensor
MKPSQATGVSTGHRFEQAAEWYLRLRGDLTADEVLEWELWYSDPRNQEALDLVRTVSPIHGRLRRPELLSAARVQADSYNGSVSVSDWFDGTAESDGEESPWKIMSRRNVRLLATATVVAVIALLGTIVFNEGQPARAIESSYVYQTKTGQHQRVTLPDGSTITLGGRTRILTQYSPARRAIFLEEGEALFTVTKNRSRPFTVVAAGGSVTAVGTKFDVRSDLNRVTVTVTDGAVDVAPSDPSVATPTMGAGVRSNLSELPRHASWTPARVAKGETITYTESGERGVVAAAEPGATEWVSGQLQYRQVPLKYVAADVQRYLDKTIVLADDATGEYEFTGTIDQLEINDWLNALEKIFPLDVTQSDDRILIQSRSGSTTLPHRSQH